MRRFRELTAALARHGGQRHLPADSPEAIWLENQRAAHRASALPEGKITLLREVGVTLRRTDLWQASYQALRDFHASNGHSRVPAGLRTPQGVDLAGWVTAQRTRHNKSQLPAEMTRLLEEIGFPWNARQEAWYFRYQQARVFKDQHGHLDVAKGTPLNAWLYQQRKKHRADQLPDDQARLLRDLGVLGNLPDGTGA